MKQKYVPLEKRSKKQQKEFHSMQRKDWGNTNPVTKKLPNAKAYNRKKARRWEHTYEPLSGFLMLCEHPQYANIFHNIGATDIPSVALV